MGNNFQGPRKEVVGVNFKLLHLIHVFLQEIIGINDFPEKPWVQIWSS